MFQITTRLIADISFGNGDAYSYLVTDEQLNDARQKMRHGLGSLEWAPLHSATPGLPDIINVRAIDRIRPWHEKVDRDALVQLWYRPQTSTLYLGDPDDAQRLFKVVGPSGVPPVDPCREFGREAYELVSGDYSLTDAEGELFIAVGRPPAQEVPDMTLVAEYKHAGGVRLLVDPATLDTAALDYLGRQVVTEYTERQRARDVAAAAR